MVFLEEYFSKLENNSLPAVEKNIG